MRKIKPPLKMTRASRRVLLVLLTGAPGLGGYTIGKVAGSHAGVYVTLARMERLGWVVTTPEIVPFGEDRPPRRFYHLTPEGRTAALGLLGLGEWAAITGTTNA